MNQLSIDHELYKAVKNGDLKTFVSLINDHHKVDVNTYSFRGIPALHLAIKEGQQEIVQWLLDQPQTDLEKQDSYGHRAIHHAVMTCKIEILEMLIKKGAQLDCRAGSCEYGNTPLHLALSFSRLECCRLLIQYGCNVNLQQGWLKQTPLHQVILCGIAPEIIQLLVDRLMAEQADHPDQLEKLIDVKNRDGTTALLMACHKKDYVSIELLVGVGADTMAIDNIGNTALILVASSPDKATIPTEEISPNLFQLYQGKINKKFIKRYPILLIFAYLIEKGCCWEATNKAGKRASDILREKRYSQVIIDVLDQFAAQQKIWPIGANGCMGLNGECSLLAVYFRPSCPHQPSFNVCSRCFPRISEQHKCGCPEGVASFKATNPLRQQAPADLVTPSIQQEAVVVVPPEDAAQNHSEPETYHKKVSPIYAFQWINGPEMGLIEDHLGNKFAWDKQVRDVRSVGYRCCYKMMDADKEGRCPAVARRFLRTPDGVPLILLQEPHNHRSGLKRSYDGGTQSNGGPGFSGVKWSCSDALLE